MKRPLALACLFFVMAIRMFYIIFPHQYHFYGDQLYDSVYVNGKVFSVEEGVVTLEGVTMYLDESEEKEVLFYHDKVLCYFNETVDISLGETVWVQGAFEDFKLAMNKGEFNSKLYYDILDVGGVVFQTSLIWKSETSNAFMGHLDGSKEFFRQKILQYFDPPYDGLLQTMLLGEKAALDADIEALYKRNGLIHILTISGLHISMIGMGIYKLLRKCKVSPSSAAFVGICMITLYGQMIGMGTSTYRAICMFLFQMSAILCKRTYDRLTGLAVAAMLILLEQPLYVFHTGFLYSFASVLGITCISPLVEHEDNRILTAFSTSIGVLVMTLPIQLYYFYEYPIYSMILNFTLLPLLPIVIGGGMLMMILPQSFAVINLVIAKGCMGILWLYEISCKITDTWIGSHFVVGAPSDLCLVLYYIVIALILIIFWRKEFKYKRACIGILLAIAMSFMFVKLPREDLQYNQLYVGQGDGAVLFIKNKSYIIDFGSTTESKVAQYTLIPFLKYFGIGHVEATFISHQDADHLNGVLQWLEAYESYGITLGSIVLPDLGEGLLEEQFGELIALASQHEIAIIQAKDGMEFDFGSAKIKVLHPREQLINQGEPNENSMVLEVQYGEYSILCTGDIHKEQELQVLEQLEGIEERTYLLKSAHHGSNTSNDAEFLEILDPKEILISYGQDNKYGHPSKETIATLETLDANVWETAIMGGIEISFSKKGYEITQYVNPKR